MNLVFLFWCRALELRLYIPSCDIHSEEIDPYPGEDIQYDVHHEDESEGHCGEEKVGDRSLHTVKVATATQTTGL